MHVLTSLLVLYVHDDIFCYLCQGRCRGEQRGEFEC